MAVEVADGSGLSKVLNPQRNRLMSRNRSEPRQCAGMTVNNCDDTAERRQILQERLYLGTGTSLSNAGELAFKSAVVQVELLSPSKAIGSR